MLELAEVHHQADTGLELAQAREALKTNFSPETIERWKENSLRFVDEQLNKGGHEVTVELPAITASTSVARQIVRMLAEAVQADEETVANLEMLVSEFIDNELEHSLGLAQVASPHGPEQTLAKPGLSITFRARIEPTVDGLDIEFSSEGPGTIPPMERDDVAQKVRSQFAHVEQPSPNELVLKDPMPDPEATDPLGESGRGFFLLSAYLADGRDGQLRYQRFAPDRHRAVLSERIAA